MKMLYILNTAKRVNNFSYTSMMAALECGIEFHIAGNWSYETEEERISDENRYGIRIHQIDFERKPYSLKNFKAYRQLLDLCKKEDFDVIHCNTPVGGLLGRIVGVKCKVKTIIYQAHGFHFYKGAPLINWLVYYPIEKWLARKTDILITINKEDYGLAKRKMHVRKGGRIECVHGVGVDVSKNPYKEDIRAKKRLELGLKESDTAIVSLGDLINRKNYQISLKALAKVESQNIHYFICGDGPKEKSLKALAKSLRLESRVHFLGFRKDVKELLLASDIFILSSKQEGLPRSVMEAMSAGLPCVVSKIRGNDDLIEDGKTGFVFGTRDIDGFASGIAILQADSETRILLAQESLKAIKKYSVDAVKNEMKDIYNSLWIRTV